MNNPKSWQLTAFVIGVASLFFLYGLAGFACESVISCPLGKYKGKLTLTDLKQQKPVTDAIVRAYIDYSSAILVNNKYPYSTTTNTEGMASIEFANVREHPLTISVSREEKRAAFHIQPGDIGLRKTIYRTKPESPQQFTEDGDIEGREDAVALELKIVSWSLF